MKTCKKEYDWTSYTIVKANATHLVFSNSAEITYYHEPSLNFVKMQE